MHGIQTSGNCIRNITTDCFAGVAADEVVDPRPYCEILRQWSTLPSEFAFLPRKFKIAVSGATEDRAATAWHDIGLVCARNERGEVGVQVRVGGGMGRTPVIGTVVREFLPWREILVFIEAIVRVYNRYGRRDNKWKARIKILVKAEGRKFIDAVEAEFAKILRRPRRLGAPADRRRARPRRGLLHAACRDHADRRAGRRRRAFIEAGPLRPLARAQRRRAPSLRLSRGDAVAQARRPAAGRRVGIADGPRRRARRALQRRRAARLARPEPGAALGARERAAGALAGGARGGPRDLQHRHAHRHDCLPGRDLCALANARSIPIAAAITERFDDLDELHDIGDIDLHISGCINSCGHHHSGHIGILGVDKDGQEWYQVSLGGADGSTLSGPSTAGKIIGPSFAATRCPTWSRR
jgi:sulfite reductase (NADPH) hemoprotein beta-component